MPYCTDRKEDVLTCMSHYCCHTCPYWSINVVKKNKDKDEDEDEWGKVNKSPSIITHKLNKTETCKNYNYWCGKLDYISNCETCEFYENE